MEAKIGKLPETLIAR